MQSNESYSPQKAEDRIDSHDPLRTADRAPESTRTNLSGTVDAATTAEPGDFPQTISIPGYEILGLLGRGGMGVVYKARHLALKRTVALKMVLAGGHASPRELARFRIEAEAVARLQHPNIVQIHEVGEAGGHPYFALEFVEGGNLAAKIDGQPLPAKEAATCVVALARAMQLAHSRNVIHRDLKPANILLEADGTPKITDFGLARQTDSDSGETQAGAVMGTPSYMAPEQAAGRAHEAGPPADVYALGAILYACLSGRPPFKGSSVVETLDQVRTQEPVPPSRLQAGVPLDLETICLKCLRKQPEERYASAAELADDLERYRRGEPILARPVGARERATKWIRRHPVGAALIAAVAIILFGAPAFSILLVERDSRYNRNLLKEQGETLREQGEKLKEAKAKRVTLAKLALASGLDLCGHGDVAKGLVALTRALAAAVEAEDEDLESAVRFNLAAWERRLWQLRAVLPAPEGTEILGVALNPEGTILAVAGTDLAVQLLSATEGQEGRILRVLSHPGDRAGFSFSMQFSADGRVLMTRTEKAVHLWTVANGEPVCPPLRHESAVSAVALDPAGRFVLTGDEKGAARLWDTATGKPLGEPFLHKSMITAVAFRGDGSQALSGSSNGALRIWTTATAKADGPSFSLKGWITTSRFSPDGGRVLVGVGSTGKGSVHILDSDSGQPVCPPLVHDGPIKELAVTPDGSKLIVQTAVSATIANVRLWDARTGRPITGALAHAGNVTSIAAGPGGATVATAGRGSVRFWDTGSGTPTDPPLYLPGPGDAFAVAFSRDGRTLMTWDGTVRLWQAPSGYLRAPPVKHDGEAYAVAFSRDGKLALTGGFGVGNASGYARLIHTATGEPASESIKHARGVLTVAFSPDGRLALTGGMDPDAHLWDTATGKLRNVLKGHGPGIYAIAFSPDGSRIVTGGSDGTARLWETETGRSLGEPLAHRGPVQTVAFSPDGETVLTGSDDKTARLWRTSSRMPIGEPLIHPQGVESVAFSSDGKTAFTASRFGKDIYRWDSATGEAKGNLVGHSNGTWSLAVTPQLLLSGSSDRTARFWNAETGEPVGLPLQHQDTVRDVAFGPEGRTALTGSLDTTARRWHAPTGTPIGPPFLHRGKIRAVALSPDGRTAATACWDGTTTLWEAPPARLGTPGQLALWAQTITGIELDDGGAVRSLSAAAWLDRRNRAKP